MTEVAAGEFGAWLAATHAVLRGTQGADVPCGDCVGCCVSSYAIPLRPTDSAVLDRVPARFLRRVEAAGQPHWQMGYDAQGHCPMFSGSGCRVYAIRPQTCRDYDCRIFAAAGLLAGDHRKATINARIQSWVFSYASEAARAAHEAVRAAGRFLERHRDLLPPGMAGTTPMGIAVLAVKVHGVFLGDDAASRPAIEIVRAIVAECQRFERG
jgi:Fe-S-cluster containining protein